MLLKVITQDLMIIRSNEGSRQSQVSGENTVTNTSAGGIDLRFSHNLCKLRNYTLTVKIRLGTIDWPSTVGG
jgi:hypothetical protein